ncbi:hypothetical protein PLESTF_000673100 [Pleodorina starrii]|nr:hypothetical protein PLESTF_000673100 [Pleodorina starrii]
MLGHPQSLHDHSTTINLITDEVVEGHGLPVRPTSRQLATGALKMHAVADFVTTYPSPQLHFKLKLLEHPDLLVTVPMRNTCPRRAPGVRKLLRCLLFQLLLGY